MNTNRILVAALVGGIVSFLLGWLVWDVLLGKFMAANAGSATGVMKEVPEWWALIVGQLAGGFLIAWIFGRWANITTAEGGAKAGAVLGLLFALTYDFTMLGVTNIMTLNGAIVDIIASAVVTAVVGAVIGWMLGRGAKA